MDISNVPVYARVRRTSSCVPIYLYCTLTVNLGNNVRRTSSCVPIFLYGTLTVNLGNNTKAWCCYKQVQCVWVVIGQELKGGVNGGHVGGWGTGVCTVQRLVVIKHRVVPALP